MAELYKRYVRVEVVAVSEDPDAEKYDDRHRQHTLYSQTLPNLDHDHLRAIIDAVNGSGQAISQDKMRMIIDEAAIDVTGAADGNGNE